MTELERTSVPGIGRGVIIGLGGMYLLAGVVRFVVQVSRGQPLSAIVMDEVLVVGVGLGLVYGARWLARSNIRPSHYLQIAQWCLAGVVAILVIIVAYELNPATAVTSPERAIPILTGLGAIAGFGVGIQRARAGELQRTKDELERTVSELEASNERLDQFASVISHDLKQPLRTLTLNLELLDVGSGAELAEEDRIMLDDAIDSAARFQEMVDGLLAYARVDSRAVQFEQVDLEAINEDVLADLEALIKERDADVTMGSLPTIHGNREQLHQVFLNLVENAIKYGGTPPRVHIDSERTDGRWHVSVTDNGIGITPEETEQIFELFGRSPRVEDYDGIGLGLAMCKQIVEQHGGDIRIESDPGDGATFVVGFPAISDFRLDRPSAPANFIETITTSDGAKAE